MPPNPRRSSLMLIVQFAVAGARLGASKVVFYEGNLAVRSKNGFFIVMIFAQLSRQAKVAAAKAVAQRVLPHLERYVPVPPSQRDSVGGPSTKGLSAA